MSKNRVGKSSSVSHGAIDIGRLNQLLASAGRQQTTATPVDTQQRELAKATAEARATRVGEIVKKWKLNPGSAEVVADNPWVEPWLLHVRQIPEAQARIAELNQDSGSIDLKIRSAKDNHDVANITVTKEGDITVSKKPRGDVLKNALEFIKTHPPVQTTTQTSVATNPSRPHTGHVNGNKPRP